MISIIVPAHNESALIGSCLGALTDGAVPGELEVIVVCNGCGDDTAQRARAVGGPVRVIETPVASKSHALNLGDEAATGFPRFYVDADVLLPLASVREVAARLEGGSALAAAPLMRFDLDGRPWRVRAFYDVWGRLPYCRQGMIGAGVYALSRAGRGRFERFPDLTADDAFVRLHFTPAERLTVLTCQFTVAAPRSLRGLLDIMTRSHFGNHELRRAQPGLWENDGAAHGRPLVKLLANPALWPAIALYSYVKLVTRLRAYWKYKYGDRRRWERDESARSAVPLVREKAA